MSLVQQLPATERFVPSVVSKRAQVSDFLLNFSVGQRLTLGFLTAALIAALTIGVTGLYHAQSLEQQSNFYQDLVQTSRVLSNGSNILVLMNIEIHKTLTDAQTRISQETIADDQKTTQDLTTRYEAILSQYKTHLIYQNPDQVTLLASANHAAQVDQQLVLVGSTMRTWKLYKATQDTVLHDVALGNLSDAQPLERLQGELTFADTLSALHGLIQFNERLSTSVRDTTSIQERDQTIMTLAGAFLACLGIILAGGLISNTFVRRLSQLRTVTQSVEHGVLDTRLPVVGRDEIADVSFSVNAMVETMLSDAIAYEQQKQLNQFKDEFIMNVSHELRTPLTQVYGFLELLIDYHDTLDSKQQKIFLNRAKYGCQELMHLVNSVLDATRASSGIKPPPLHEIAVAEVAREVLDNLDPRYKEEYTLNLNVPADLMVSADRQYLRQILRNLVSNAFKYSSPQTTITIDSEMPASSATTEEKTDLQVVICVRDTGPGIPPSEIPQLFQRFARLKRDVSGTVRGTGLGLYVCKQLVEAMNGTIWVESTGVVGEGSRFCFTLDSVAASPHTASASEASEASDGTQNNDWE